MDDQDQKQDLGKPPMWRGLLKRFPRALAAVAEISAYGHSKYCSWDGWESVDVDRYRDAMIRHLAADAAGENIDQESGLAHRAHAAWGALATLEITLRNENQ